MSFRKIGTIALILNSKFAVIKSTEALILGSEVIVYNEINLADEQKNSLNLSNPSIPKGKLKILMLQEDKTYLASVISQKHSDNSSDNQSLARSLSLYHSIFGAADPEVGSGNIELASYSAILDNSQSLNIKISDLVQVGDAVTFVQPVKIESDKSIANEPRLSNPAPTSN